jgi:SlyX protein
MEAMDKQRLELIETRLAFQEQAIQELSDTVYRQEQQITALKAAFDLLKSRISEVVASLPETEANDETPPHY